MIKYHKFNINFEKIKINIILLKKIFKKLKLKNINLRKIKTKEI